MTRFTSLVFYLCVGVFAAPVHAANILFLDSSASSEAQAEWYEALGLSRDHQIGIATPGENIVFPMAPLFSTTLDYVTEKEHFNGLLTTRSVECGQTACDFHQASSLIGRIVLGFNNNGDPADQTYSNGFELEFGAGINGLLMPLRTNLTLKPPQLRITVDGGDENFFSVSPSQEVQYFAIASDEPFTKVRLSLVNSDETFLDAVFSNENGVRNQLRPPPLISWDSTVYNPVLSPAFGYPDPPAPVPLPASFAMLGLGLGGLGLVARRKRRAGA